ARAWPLWFIRRGPLLMAVPFSHTFRALEAGKPRRHTLALAGLALLGAWAAWATLARVPLWVVTDTARLEVDSAAHPITTLVGGRVVQTRLRLGQEIRAGEVVVVLDSESEERALKEKQTRRRARGRGANRQGGPAPAGGAFGGREVNAGQRAGGRAGA